MRSGLEYSRNAVGTEQEHEKSRHRHDFFPLHFLLLFGENYKVSKQSQMREQIKEVG